MTVIFVVSGTTFSAPGDWPGSGQVECIGGGGAGADSNASLDEGAGGGGGAYSKKNSLTFANGASLQVGAGGATAGASGTDTWVSSTASVLAKAGAGASTAASTGGAGGASASGVGDVKNSGGVGGAATAGIGGAGGGGAGGPNGVGGAGAANVSSVDGGGGGGGNGGGAAGAVPAGVTGGTGGNNSAATGGGAGGGQDAVGTAGTAGGGGGGGGKSTATPWIQAGGNGGAGTEWDASHGSGGGGGGTGNGPTASSSTTVKPGNGGLYGGGGGGSGGSGATTFGTGAQGIIVITYTPSGGAALAGTPAAAASATGALSTGIPVAGAANVSVSDTAALSTAIQLAGAAVIALTASGTFPGANPISGSASSATSASGALTTAIQAAAAASAVASASAALTNWATVVLTAPLSTGLGSIVDAHLWPHASRLPQVGDTIYYDPTFVTVNTNGTISSTSNNCTAVVQFNDGTAWQQGLIFLTPGLAGYADIAEAGVGALSTAIILAGALVASALASAGLTTGIPLSGSLAASIAMAGPLTTGIAMAAAAAASMSATGSLPGSSAALAGNASIGASAAGALGTGIKLAGAAQAVASATGAPTTGIPLAGAASVGAAVAGALSSRGYARQIVTLDPAPSNSDMLFGAPEAMWAAFPLATLAGSTILAYSQIANLTGHTINGLSDSVNGAWPAVRERQSNPTNGSDEALWAIPNAASIPAGAFGRATAAGTTTTFTDSSQNGKWTLNQFAGAFFRNVTTGAQSTVASNTTTGQVTLNTALPAAVASGDTYVIGGWIKATASGFDDYNALTLVECAGCAAASVVAHSSQAVTTTAPGTNDLSTGNMVCGSSPVTVYCFAADDVDNSTPYAPNADAAAVDDGTAWVFNLGQPIMHMEHYNLANPGTFAGKFSSRATAGDHHQVFGIALLDAAQGANLAGTPSATAAASGALSTGIPLQGAPSAAVSATGALRTGDRLQGAPNVGVSAAAPLTTGIPLTGAAAAAASAGAPLSTGIPMQGAPSVAVSAGGSFNPGAPLQGAAGAAASAAAALTTGIKLATAAQAASNAAASLPVKSYRPAHLDISIQKPSPDGLYWGRYPQGNKPSLAGSASVSSGVAGAATTAIRAVGAASISTSGSAELNTGAGLAAPTQFQMVAQGGSTNNAGSVTSPKMQQMLVWAPVTGADHYQIIRRTNYGADVDYATTTNNWYVDTACTNFFSATNIAQDPSPHGAATGPTTVYDYDVVAVDASGSRSAKPAQFTLWGYRGGITGTATAGSTTTLVDSAQTWATNQWLGYYLFANGHPSAVIVSNTSNTLVFRDLDGNAFGSAVATGATYQIGGDYFNAVGDVSFGQAAGSPAFTDPGGSPVSPHAFCLRMTHDASSSDNMGLQRPSASPAGFIYGVEIGAFNYAVWNQRSPVSGSYTEYAMHHRGPPGDLAGPHTNISGASMVSQGYGPAQVASTWQSFAVPTAAIQCSSPAGGVTSFSFTLSGSTLTVSGISGPGIDDGCWMTGTGIPTGTYVNPTPSQTGNGSYTVAGAGIPVSSPVSGSDGKAWATNMYKGQYKVVGSFANLTWYYDDIGWVRSISVAAGA